MGLSTWFRRSLSLRAAIHEVGRKKVQTAQNGEAMDGGDQGKCNRLGGSEPRIDTKGHEWERLECSRGCFLRALM